jgi:hypothetical protein
MTPLARILKPKYSKGTSNWIVNFMCEFSKGAPFQKPKPTRKNVGRHRTDLDDHELIVVTCGPGGVDCRAMRGKQEGLLRGKLTMAFRCAAPLSRGCSSRRGQMCYRARTAATVDSCLTVVSLRFCRVVNKASSRTPCPGLLTSRGLFFGGGGSVLSVRSVSGALAGAVNPTRPAEGVAAAVS